MNVRLLILANLAFQACILIFWPMFPRHPFVWVWPLRVSLFLFWSLYCSLLWRPGANNPLHVWYLRLGIPIFLLFFVLSCTVLWPMARPLELDRIETQKAVRLQPFDNCRTRPENRAWHAAFASGPPGRITTSWRGTGNGVIAPG